MTHRSLKTRPVVEKLVSLGHQVIRFDNRDCGRSTWLRHLRAPSPMTALTRALAGLSVPAPYTLWDMADDIVALLDALEIERAHVAGISLGGMIAQRVALDHPDRVLSLTSIMSTSGASGLPEATPEAREALMSSPASADRETVVEHTLRTDAVWASPGFPTPEAERREQAERSYDRCYAPEALGLDVKWSKTVVFRHRSLTEDEKQANGGVTDSFVRVYLVQF